MQIRKLLLAIPASAAVLAVVGCVDTPASRQAAANGPQPTFIATVGNTAVLPAMPTAKPAALAMPVSVTSSGACLVPSARTDKRCGWLVTAEHPLEPGESVRVVEGLPLRQRELAGGVGDPRFQTPDGMWTPGWGSAAMEWKKVFETNPAADPRRPRMAAAG